MNQRIQHIVICHDAHHDYALFELQQGIYGSSAMLDSDHLHDGFANIKATIQARNGPDREDFAVTIISGSFQPWMCFELAPI